MIPNPPDPLEILDAGQESRAALFAPSPVYCTGEENLRVTAVSNTASVVLAISGRSLRPNSTPSPLNETLKPTSNRVVTTGIFGLAEGWLLGVTIRASGGSPAAGSTYVIVELVRGSGSAAQVVQTLGEGFVTANAPYAWPGSVNTAPLDGPGHLRSITGAVPAAGAEIVETVPTGAQWELVALAASLTTAVAVANRIVALLLDDGTNVYFRDSPAISQAASLTDTYSFAQGQSKLAAPVASSILGNLPVGVRLAAAHRIRTSTTAIQAADQWTAPQYLVKERFPLE